MNFDDLMLRDQTRRHFFENCAMGAGAIGLASLMQSEQRAQAGTGKLHGTHHPPKAKNVIYMFMAGGPSQLEMFDFKPKLQELEGKVIPESYVEGKQFAFLKKDAKLLGTRRKFKKHGESGMELSEVVPHLAEVADDITILKSMKTDVFNHGPAKLFMNTGTQQFGRPSMGAWVTYGIGSESQNLPGFVVLQSGPRGPRGGAPLWGSGFLPTTYQGVPFLNGADPILNLSSPSGINSVRQSEFIDTVNQLNSLRLEKTRDPEIATRISAYEMAYRMQSSAPELMDLSGETKETLDLYGVDPAKPSYARNCLLARRLVEKGCRFVQLYHTDWDHHGNKGTDLGESLDARCLETDQASAALVKDLKQRGLLDDTLVIWGGEFGRTPQGEPRDLIGRDHHIDAFSIWVAGGGSKPGVTIGETDELGYYSVEDTIHVRDFHATVLHLLGIDHHELSYFYQGLDFRLTGVEEAHVVEKMLA
ncbi:DUF1501 domain-containing protein [Gimesia chilikensis]|uniref:DUF1501 domain-containing protein n=1 Tax=Gimesia chilikensis TaxID=2605989 RepID=A0A517PWH4_9PLAN|nr:DUF1501 domain-containing protein [Gimesia chilikensis]QDT23721.1 hypothetical protein HG66A1_55450 [Gimesia chilikensis]